MTQISRLKVFQPGKKALSADVNAEFDNILKAHNDNDKTLTDLLNILQSVLEGNSGANYVKATSITGLTGNDVQSLLESLNTLFANLQQQITDFHDETGAANIGTSPITGVTGTNVQDMLVSLKSLVNQGALGQIPDGSITVQKLAFDPATQIELNNHTNDTSAHVSLTDRNSWNANASKINDLEILYWMG